MRKVAPLLALALAVPALAETPNRPTLEQLQQRPAATEIVRRWVDICVANAGDRPAQERAARRMGLNWPYMLMNRDDPERGETCALVSTVAAADDTTSLGLAIESAARSYSGFELAAVESYMRGFVTVGGRRYLILANIDQQAGEAFPTAVLSLSRNRSDP